MDKKEEFKIFARKHPELVSFVKDKSMTWQKFYEIYDIYGEDNKAWESYLNSNNNATADTLNDFSNKLKNIDINSIQEHIKTAEKALGLISELTNKSESVSPLRATVPKVPRPINKFFED